jgi:integrase/recombinase XerD
MAQVLDSCYKLPDGKQIVRWHLLDNDYQLIRPVERFLRSKLKAGMVVGTLKTYSHNLKVFWQFLELQGIDWGDFNRDHLKDLAYWCLTGRFYAIDSVSPRSEEISAIRQERTVNLILTVVTEFYEYHAPTIGDKHLKKPRKGGYVPQTGILAGHFKQAPVFQKVVRYKEQKKFPGCLQSAQVQTLIDACHTARDKLILWLMVDTGMRIGEVLGLHAQDIDWNKREIHIIRRDNPNGALAKGVDRQISIAKLMRDPEFCDVLNQYFDEERPEDRVEELGHEMVFVVLHQGSRSYGQPLPPQNINKLIERLHEKTGIELDRIYPHLFRHSFVTANIRNARLQGKSKEDIAKTIQKQIGHRSIATTLDIYDHSFSEADLVEEINRVTGDKSQ